MAVDFQRVVCAVAVDDGEGVEGNGVTSQQFDACHHFVVASLARCVAAETVVDSWRAVDGDAYKEMVLGKELAPFVGQQRSVGLEGVGDIYAMAAEALHAFDGLAVEIEPCEGWLAALPAEKVVFHGECEVL